MPYLSQATKRLCGGEGEPPMGSSSLEYARRGCKGERLLPSFLLKSVTSCPVPDPSSSWGRTARWALYGGERERSYCEDLATLAHRYPWSVLTIC